MIDTSNRDWYENPMTPEELHAWARIACTEWRGSGQPQTPLYIAVMEQYDAWGNAPGKFVDGHYLPSKENYDEIDYRCLCWFSHIDECDG